MEACWQQVRGIYRSFAFIDTVRADASGCFPSGEKRGDVKLWDVVGCLDPSECCLPEVIVHAETAFLGHCRWRRVSRVLENELTVQMG